ncbi:MAG: TIGR03618 family F420-dependent PPOX class oxidoreductase [Chloroflexia bacterium]
MTQDEATEYLRSNHQGVLATIKRDGRPQLSHIGYLYDKDDRVKVSVTLDRAKTHNALRDPRVSMSVIGESWWQYLVVEGTAEILQDDPLAELRYEGMSGKPHPNWRSSTRR